MKARSFIGKALLVLVLPFVFLGLIDPLEGGLSLIVASLIYAVAFVLLKAAPSRWLWIPFAAALVTGIAAILWAIFAREGQQPGPLPPFLIYLLWGYRLAVGFALVGALLTIFKHLVSPALARRKN